VWREERERERADRGLDYEAVNATAHEPPPEAGTEDEPKPEIRTTDRGNGLRLVERYQEAIRYCHPWKSWLLWDGTRWKPGCTAAAMRLAKQTITYYIQKTLKEMSAITKAIQETNEESTKQTLLKKLDATKTELTWLIKSE